MDVANAMSAGNGTASGPAPLWERYNCLRRKFSVATRVSQLPLELGAPLWAWEAALMLAPLWKVHRQNLIVGRNRSFRTDMLQHQLSSIDRLFVIGNGWKRCYDCIKVV